METRRYPRDPREDCGRCPFSSPAYVQFMGLLQDLPQLEEECQATLYPAAGLDYLLWKLVEADGQPLLPRGFQFTYLENIARELQPTRVDVQR